MSVNTLILEALQAEVDRVKDDKDFMAVLRSHIAVRIARNHPLP